jgi:hypothetical protein
MRRLQQYKKFFGGRCLLSLRQLTQVASYSGNGTLIALLPRSHKGTLRNALDFCAESAKIKRIPKVPFPQRGSKAANVAY